MEKPTRRKESWTAPELTVYGSVEEVTGQQVKQFGLSDGITFLGTPIGGVS